MTAREKDKQRAVETESSELGKGSTALPCMIDSSQRVPLP